MKATVTFLYGTFLSECVVRGRGNVSTELKSLTGFPTNVHYHESDLHKMHGERFCRYVNTSVIMQQIVLLCDVGDFAVRQSSSVEKRNPCRYSFR